MERGKYLALPVLISSDCRRYGDLVVALKNDYAKQQKNYPKTVKEMYGIMVVFEPTRVAPVAGGFYDVVNSGNVTTKIEEGEYGGANRGRKREC